MALSLTVCLCVCVLPRLQEEIQLREEAENNLAAFRAVSLLWPLAAISLFSTLAPLELSQALTSLFPLSRM